MTRRAAALRPEVVPTKRRDRRHAAGDDQARMAPNLKAGNPGMQYPFTPTHRLLAP
ncbi:hypothetical protein SALB1_3194 [Salinisphaera sp. LB1]|nr:hypothetical protein SALB1_3194 [Salinisphaera sp. LB1]